MTKNSVLYVYARKKYKNYEWAGTGGDAITRSCDGESLKMRRTDFVNGQNNLLYTFICTNSRRDLREGLPTLTNKADIQMNSNATVYDAMMGSWLGYPSTPSSSLRSSGTYQDDPTYWLDEPPEEDLDVEVINPSCLSEHTIECDQSEATLQKKSMYDDSDLLEMIWSGTNDRDGDLLTKEDDDGND